MGDETIGFMCKVDYDFHLGCDSLGTGVYPSLEKLREFRKCVDECGIVKVSVKLVEVVAEGKHS